MNKPNKTLKEALEPIDEMKEKAEKILTEIIESKEKFTKEEKQKYPNLSKALDRRMDSEES